MKELREKIINLVCKVHNHKKGENRVFEISDQILALLPPTLSEVTTDTQKYCECFDWSNTQAEKDGNRFCPKCMEAIKPLNRPELNMVEENRMDCGSNKIQPEKKIEEIDWHSNWDNDISIKELVAKLNQIIRKLNQ